jgi:hypothetical protein
MQRCQIHSTGVTRFVAPGVNQLLDQGEDGALFLESSEKAINNRWRKIKHRKIEWKTDFTV